MSDYEDKLDEIRKAIEERRAANEALHEKTPGAIANGIAVEQNHLESERAAAEQAQDEQRIQRAEGELAKLPEKQQNQLEFEDLRYKVETAAVKQAEHRLDDMVEIHQAQDRQLRDSFRSENQEAAQPEVKFDQKEMDEKREILRDRIVAASDVAVQVSDLVGPYFGIPNSGNINDAIPQEVKESAVEGVLMAGEHVVGPVLGRMAEAAHESTPEEIEAGVQKAIEKDKNDEARRDDPAGVEDRARLDADQKHHRDQADELTAFQSSDDFKNQSFEQKSQQLKDLFQKQDQATEKSHTENRVHHDDLKGHQDQVRDDMQSDTNRQRYDATRDVCRDEATKTLEKTGIEHDAEDVKRATNAFQEQTFPEVSRANKTQHDQPEERQPQKFDQQFEQLKAKQTEELSSPRTGPNRDDPNRNRDDPDRDR